jgi:hypothetical protein
MRLATNGPKPVVIDEFPFLAKATPALPSLIQRALEPAAQRRNTPVRLLLCGSALSFMGHAGVSIQLPPTTGWVSVASPWFAPRARCAFGVSIALKKV